MPLINCKVELSLKWIENCMLTVADTATFKQTDAKLYVPIVTLSSEDNVKLSKLLSDGFKRPIYWKEYKIIPNKIVNIANDGGEYYIRELLDSSWPGIIRLFVFAYNNKENDNGQVYIDSYKKIFSSKS